MGLPFAVGRHVSWQHLLKFTQKFHLIEITVEVCKDMCTMAFIPELFKN